MSKDGGSAYPMYTADYDHDGRYIGLSEFSHGISYLDYMAGQALPEAMRLSAGWYTKEKWVGETAIIAYEIARAMLAEREKGQ